MCRRINGVDLLIVSDFSWYIEYLIVFSIIWGHIPGWSVELKMNWQADSWVPKIFKLIQNNFCMYAAQIPVDLLIYQTDHHWPKKSSNFTQSKWNSPLICWLEIKAGRREIRHSAQIPVDLLIYRPAQYWSRMKLKFPRYSAQNPVDLLIYHPAQYWSRIKLKFPRCSAQKPVDLLIYHPEHPAQELKLKFSQCVRHIPVDMLKRNSFRQRNNKV